MGNENENESVFDAIDKTQAAGWSGDDVANYETALEAINRAAGECSRAIAIESRKSAPDPALIDRLKNARRALGAVRENLDSRDHELVFATRKKYSNLAKRIREGEA